MSIVEENVKSTVNEKSGIDSKIKYDENYEGCYVVTAPALNVRSVPDAKKANSVIKCALNGEKICCDGNYVVIGGTRWLHIDFNGILGFVSDKFIMKL